MALNLLTERRRRQGGPVYRVGGPQVAQGWLVASTPIGGNPKWKREGNIAQWLDLEAALRAAAWAGGSVWVLLEDGSWRQLAGGAH